MAIVVLLLVASAGAWAFAEVADEVQEGEARTVDEALVFALRQPDDPQDPLGPWWFEEAVRDVTSLGGTGVLVLLSVAVLGYLLIERKPRAALFVTVAIVGGHLLSTLLKNVFARPRPDLVTHSVELMSGSFPSGHALLAATTYLTLGALLARLHERWRVKVYLLAVAAILTVLVGASRVYLGVHWPTDVLAGWSAGATWALVCWTAASVLQRRGVVEEEE